MSQIKVQRGSSSVESSLLAEVAVLLCSPHGKESKFSGVPSYEDTNLT